MYTQCSNCNAIFRVSMKEVTSAQGELRCGECDHIFNAMDTLSSTLPDDINTLGNSDDASTPHIAPSLNKRPEQTNTHDSFTPNKMRKYMFLIGLLLTLLLLMQVLHSFRNTLAHYPLTSGITRTFCKVTGCEITPQRAPTKIKIISRNVYAHPNEAGSLIISASLKNQASHQQPLPLVEVSFLNKKGDVFALSRFRPEVYLHNRKNKLFESNETIIFRLKIADPGPEAVRFKFKFL